MAADSAPPTHRVVECIPTWRYTYWMQYDVKYSSAYLSFDTESPWKRLLFEVMVNQLLWGQQAHYIFHHVTGYPSSYTLYIVYIYAYCPRAVLTLTQCCFSHTNTISLLAHIWQQTLISSSVTVPVWIERKREIEGKWIFRPRDSQSNTTQHNATDPRQSFFKEKMSCLRQDPNPRQGRCSTNWTTEAAYLLPQWILAWLLWNYIYSSHMIITCKSHEMVKCSHERVIRRWHGEIRRVHVVWTIIIDLSGRGIEREKRRETVKRGKESEKR